MTCREATYNGTPVYRTAYTERGNLAFCCECREVHTHGAADGAGHRAAHCQHHRSSGYHLLLPETTA